MRREDSMAVCLCGVALSAFTPHGDAAQITYVSNLTATTVADGLVEQTSWFASQFTTGPDALGYALNAIQVGLDGTAGNPSGFSLTLFSDNSGAPGTSLGPLSGSTNPSTAGTYTYTASGIALSPSTPYWIVLATASAQPTGYYWNITSSTTYTSSDAWEINTTQMYGSHDQGTSWSKSGADSAGQFNVSATAVPEPGTLAVVALASPALLRRRRKGSVTYT